MDHDRAGAPPTLVAPAQSIAADSLDTGTIAPALRGEPAFFPALPQVESGAAAHVHWHLNGRAEKLVVSSAVAPLAREQYGKLAAALYQAQLDRRATVVVLTSAVPGEGKTLTATNLALTFSESYRRRVLLVDADLRRPMVHEMFGVPNAAGLGDLLEIQGLLPLTQLTAKLSLLTAGDARGDPMKTLSSDRMRALVEEARGKFDWVLLDTAPIGLWPDAKVLGSTADVALLVVSAGSTAYDVIQRAAEALGPDRVRGVVLNRVTDAALPLPYDEHYKTATSRARS